MLDKIIFELSKGEDIEDILEKYDWKKFEKVIAEIFRENDFLTRQNFRFKTKKRYEIDVIAVKNNQVICVDCKWWRKGRYKKSGLKTAIKLHEKRTKEFEKFLKENSIAQSLLNIEENFVTNSLLVTLYDEAIVKEGETLIVPVWKLNSLLNEVI